MLYTELFSAPTCIITTIPSIIATMPMRFIFPNQFSLMEYTHWFRKEKKWDGEIIDKTTEKRNNDNKKPIFSEKKDRVGLYARSPQACSFYSCLHNYLAHVPM
jgi:hypothetical protein